MKPHLIVKLHRPLMPPPPYWEHVVSDKTNVATFTGTPAIDTLFREYQLRFWLTTNYQTADTEWSTNERRHGFDRVYRLVLQHDSDIPEPLLNRLRTVPDVEYAYAGAVATAPLPETGHAETASFTSRYRPDRTLLREAHLISMGHPEIRVAVLDTGFEATHPELQHAMLGGRDFVHILGGAAQFFGDFLDIDDLPEDDVGHGTHVAGIIVAKGLRMPLGVVPRCKLIPVKVLGALRRGEVTVGAGLIDNINNGIKWAVDQGADVINMSLGIKHQQGGLPHEDVIRYALSRGVTVVAASGNDGTGELYYPGALPGVIAVGAADDYGQMAPFSSFGGHVSVTAPGVNIYSSHLHGGYALSSGTSQAAPFVSGAVALLQAAARQLRARLSSSQIMYLLKHTADRSSEQFRTLKEGFGHLNILDALRLMRYSLAW